MPLWAKITIAQGHSPWYSLVAHFIGFISLFVFSFTLYAVGHIPLQYPIMKSFFIVGELDEQSILRTAGLKPVDTIVNVNDKVPTSDYGFSDMLKPAPGASYSHITVAREHGLAETAGLMKRDTILQSMINHVYQKRCLLI